ncbi:hypothetical protein ACFQ0Q_11775 [Streptomyces aureus]
MGRRAFIASPPRPPRTHPAVLVNWIGDVIAYADGYERYARPHRVPRTGPRGPRAGLSPRHGASIHEPRVAALVDELTVTAGAPVADRLAAVPPCPGAPAWTSSRTPRPAHSAWRTRRRPCPRPTVSASWSTGDRRSGHG